MYKIGGSSGGTDFISSYISLKRNYSISKLFRILNMSLILISVSLDKIVFENGTTRSDLFETIFYTFLKDFSVIFSLLFVAVSAFIMNRVYPQFMLITLFIITKQVFLVKQKIYEEKYKHGGNI
jgi:uncharacterized membrane-anchored protein YitT (DUF2179 family)